MNTFKIPEIDLNDYDYQLPKERIALYPSAIRGNSKLIYANHRNKSISHHTFSDITDLLPENSLLVMNETKVIAARILMKKQSGGRAEILCTEPFENEPENAMLDIGSSKWKCIIGGRKIVSGDILLYEDCNKLNLLAKVLEKEGSDAVVELKWEPGNLTFACVLELVGETPLPPYIKREAEDSDKARYQTIYAKNNGSVAAPTAGLHFTDELLNELKKHGILQEKLTLHVGPGTFVPIEGDIVGHQMHNERIAVSASTLNYIKSYIENARPIICTGTTAMRTLESLYWFGCQISSDVLSIISGLPQLHQWTPYQTDLKRISLPEAIDSILDYLAKNNKHTFVANTSLFIVPGYDFKYSNGLITNFHIPKSTLLLLVSAFIGYDLWKETYQTAINSDYRFLSYGDACLFLK